MEKITIIGTGYVGLVTGVSLASLGHKVICVGRNKEKIRSINSGKSPFFEPGLDPLLRKLVRKGLIIATNNLEESVKHSDFTILAVGTPTVDNKIDLSEIKEVSKQIGRVLKEVKGYHVVVVKSTVVPGTSENIVKPLLEQYSFKTVGKDFGLCMNPEFLREGKALEDALELDRIVIGQYDLKSGKTFSKIYSKFKCPILFTNLKTAELIKYASNSLLATLISFSNEIARIAEKADGIDVLDVWKGVHLDRRLSPRVGKKLIKPGILSYILSGCGYGGSCFPKDTKALSNFADGINENALLIKSVIKINDTQPARVISLLKKAIGNDLRGKKIALLGLTFKADTDDLRESAALKILNELKLEGSEVISHDPWAYKKNVPQVLSGYKLADKIEEALVEADAAILVTAWKEYLNLTPEFLKRLMKNPILIDGRRVLDKNKFIKKGVIYKGIGLSQ